MYIPSRCGPTHLRRWTSTSSCRTLWNLLRRHVPHIRPETFPFPTMNFLRKTHFSGICCFNSWIDRLRDTPQTVFISTKQIMYVTGCCLGEVSPSLPWSHTRSKAGMSCHTSWASPHKLCPLFQIQPYVRPSVWCWENGRKQWVVCQSITQTPLVVPQVPAPTTQKTWVSAEWKAPASRGCQPHRKAGPGKLGASLCRRLGDGQNRGGQRHF